ncbi:MAG: BUG/TctC family periplasmic protein, partial [uncultured Acetobacteraceae bacterium]
DPHASPRRADHREQARLAPQPGQRPAARGGRTRGDGADRFRLGARPPVAPGGAVPTGRADRHRRPAARAEAGGTARPTRGGGEPRRRGRQHRRGARGALARGRAHAAAGDRRRDGDQPGAVRAPVLRRGDGP